MGESAVKVVRVGKVEKHPGADTLSVTEVNGAYPVVFRTGEFQEGDLVVYVPVDSVVPANHPSFEHISKESFRVKARKLRGVMSMGFLIPAQPGWALGQEVGAELRIEKYLPPWESAASGENERDPGFLPVYDVEGWMRWANKIEPGERVRITEKIEGENARFAFHQGRLWVGSRTNLKKDAPGSKWWQAARAYRLEEKLARHPGIIVYGEIHGYVRGFPYGVRKGDVGLRLFDAWVIEEGRWMEVEEFQRLFDAIEVPEAPVLYEGPWEGQTKERWFEPLANGGSTLDASHVREGIVIRTVPLRFDPECGRLVFKYKGSDYLTRKALCPSAIPPPPRPLGTPCPLAQPAPRRPPPRP